MVDDVVAGVVTGTCTGTDGTIMTVLVLFHVLVLVLVLLIMSQHKVDIFEQNLSYKFFTVFNILYLKESRVH